MKHLPLLYPQPQLQCERKTLICPWNWLLSLTACCFLRKADWYLKNNRWILTVPSLLLLEWVLVILTPSVLLYGNEQEKPSELQSPEEMLTSLVHQCWTEYRLYYNSSLLSLKNSSPKHKPRFFIETYNDSVIFDSCSCCKVGWGILQNTWKPIQLMHIFHLNLCTKILAVFFHSRYFAVGSSRWALPNFHPNCYLLNVSFDCI